MAFSLQTDEGDVADANAYIDVDFYRAYWTDRAVDTADSEDAAVQAAIILATEYLDNRFNFKGDKLSEEQSTEFPRDEFTGIPTKLKEVVAEYAKRALVASLAPDPTVDASGARVVSKTEIVGPIEETTRFSESSSIQLFKPYPLADMKLKSFVAYNGRVIR